MSVAEGLAAWTLAGWEPVAEVPEMQGGELLRVALFSVAEWAVEQVAEPAVGAFVAHIAVVAGDLQADIEEPVEPVLAEPEVFRDIQAVWLTRQD